MSEKRTQNPATEQYPSYSVLKAVLEYEQRAVFVERICSSATECRFGPDDRPSRFVIADINPQIDLPVFNDLTDENRVPFYKFSLKRGELAETDGILPAAGSFLTITDRRSRIVSLASNPGRGSPKIHGTQDAGAGCKPAFLTAPI